jgi:hypothetical protein
MALKTRDIALGSFIFYDAGRACAHKNSALGFSGAGAGK